MPITYAGQVCYDAGVCLKQCRQQGLPTDWAYKANRYVHPIGMKAGFGHILLRGGQLNRFVLGKGYDLELKNASGSSVTLKNIRVIGEPLCVTPGHESTLDNAMFLVELSDRRYDLIGLANTCYNWVAYPTAAYSDFSLDNGLEWTLERIIEDLLQQSGLGAIGPGNFYDPSETLTAQLSDGTNRYQQYSQIAPWQIDARASRAIDCAEDLLYQYGFLFWYDIFNDVFGVYDAAYNISVTDTPDFRGINKRKRLLDSYEGQPGLASGSYIPKYIRIMNPVYAPYNSIVPLTDYACVDIQDSGTANNYIVYAQNPCPALVDETGTITNSTQLSTNAIYVNTAIRQMIARRNDSSFHRVYAGFDNYETNDNTIYYDAMFWQDLGDGRGPCTGVVRVGNQGIVPLRTVQSADLISSPELRSRVPTNDTPTNGDDNSFVWMNGNTKNPLLRASTPDDIYTAPSYARWDMSHTYGAGGMRESILRFVHGASKGLNINRSVLRWADALTEGVGGEYGNRKWWYQKFRPNYTGVVRVTGPACTPGSGSASGSCSSGSSSGLNGLYAGFTQYYDVNSNTFIDGEPCYVIEAAGNNLEEREYVALRSDSKNGIPVFITNCCADGGGSGSGSGSAAECDACLSRLCISYNSSGSGSGSGAAFRLFYLDANGCYREVPTCPDGIYDGFCPGTNPSEQDVTSVCLELVPGISLPMYQKMYCKFQEIVSGATSSFDNIDLEINYNVDLGCWSGGQCLIMESGEGVQRNTGFRMCCAAESGFAFYVVAMDVLPGNGYPYDCGDDPLDYSSIPSLEGEQFSYTLISADPFIADFVMSFGTSASGGQGSDFLFGGAGGARVRFRVQDQPF